ncbi:MAG: succinylglutamate desuccinylase/aspartoacylase family protein [Pseudomonadota bacterium]
MRELRVGTAAAGDPGTVAKGKLRTGTYPDGAAIEIPVVIVRGAMDGPTLWVQGCVHGNEPSGTYIIHRFLKGLDPNALSGAVVALPVLNLTAFQHNRRTSPFEIYQGGDLNRVFPGKPDGTFTEQMAHAIFQALIAVADYMVDFHSAGSHKVMWSLYTALEGEVGSRAQGMARAFGYPAIYPTPKTRLTGGAYMQAAIHKGIPGLIVEHGGKASDFTDAGIADAVERLRNVCRHLKLLAGEVKTYPGAHFVKEFVWVRSTFGGLFRPDVAPGERIKKNQPLGRLYDLFGNLRKEVRSPHAGLVLTINSGPTMVAGDTLIHIGTEPRAA